MSRVSGRCPFSARVILPCWVVISSMFTHIMWSNGIINVTVWMLHKQIRRWSISVNIWTEYQIFPTEYSTFLKLYYRCTAWLLYSVELFQGKMLIMHLCIQDIETLFQWGKQSLCLKQHNKNRKWAVKKCVITEAILTARVVHGATDPIVRGWLIYQN